MACICYNREPSYNREPQENLNVFDGESDCENRSVVGNHKRHPTLTAVLVFKQELLTPSLAILNLSIFSEFCS